MSLLDTLARHGWLRVVDHELALALRRLRPDSDDRVLAAAALASRALAFGHAGLPLREVDALLEEIAPGREPPLLPEADAWIDAVRASSWTAPGGPLVIEDDRVALRRYHDYETRLATALLARTGAPAPPPAAAQGITDGAQGAIAGATHVRATNADATNADATDADATDADATDVGATDVGATNVRATNANATNAGATNAGATNADAINAGASHAGAAAADADAADASRLRDLFPSFVQDPEDRQAHAARAFRAARLLLLTGGPGTGKTTTVARALVLRIEAALRAGRPAPRIALAAPTGKAAARLAEAVRETAQRLLAQGLVAADVAAALPAQASTLHRLLGWRSESTRFRHDAEHPLPADVVVVDEASMVDLPLMCKLVEAVAPDAALLLVGDRDQLPSVETGDVLAALCDAADAGGPLAPHRVALTRSHRQREGLDSAALAARVRDGDADGALDALRDGTLRGIDWLPAHERSPWPAIQARVLGAMRAVQAASSPSEALHLARRLRVLTAVRDGAAGSLALNEHVAQALQGPGTRAERFFHGALLIVTENSYRHGLFNGDIGIAWEEPDGTLRVWFEREADGGLRAWLPGALPAHEPAFALTVHKSQGSEFDEVVLVLPPGGSHRALSRELLYTGLTRARHALALWADEPALRAAIERRALRWSGLAARLR